MSPEQALELYLSAILEGCNKERHEMVIQKFKNTLKECYINQQETICRDIVNTVGAIKHKKFD
jgi:hypothetical protein